MKHATLTRYETAELEQDLAVFETQVAAQEAAAEHGGLNNEDGERRAQEALRDILGIIDGPWMKQKKMMSMIQECAMRGLHQDGQPPVLSAKESVVVEESALEVLLQTPPPQIKDCLLYTSPSPRDATLSRMPSSA